MPETGPGLVTCYAGIGSNVDRERNLNRGLEMLRERFGQIIVSPVYQCPAVGFEGEDFYNCVAAFDSEDSPQQVAAVLRDIEDQCGRDRSQPKFSPRTLDIDLLLYGEQVIDQAGLKLPRNDILEYDFVLRPLAELAPTLQHPAEGRPLSALWEEFDKSKSQLRLVCLPALAPMV